MVCATGRIGFGVLDIDTTLPSDLFGPDVQRSRRLQCLTEGIDINEVESVISIGIIIMEIPHIQSNHPSKTAGYSG